MRNAICALLCCSFVAASQLNISSKVDQMIISHVQSIFHELPSHSTFKINCDRIPSSTEDAVNDDTFALCNLNTLLPREKTCHDGFCYRIVNSKMDHSNEYSTYNSTWMIIKTSGANERWPYGK